MKNKIAAILLLIAFVGAGFLYFPKEAKADIISDQICNAYSKTIGKLIKNILPTPRPPTPSIPGATSQEVPVIDITLVKTVEKESRSQQETNKQISCQDFVKKILLAELKKRLLDTLVDQIIQWIQGGGKPKFVEDFGGTLEDAAQAAVGDVAREVGLGELCSPLKLSVRVGVQQPSPFSQRVSCTLDDIVGNVNDFINDFSKGGWIGYNEIWQPQNNIYGLWLITNEEIAARTKKEEEATKQEIQAGRGFQSVRKCGEWTLYAENDLANIEELERKVTEEFPDPKPYDPSIPPEIPPYANDPSLGYYNPEWKCTKPLLTTPGTVIAYGLEKSLYSDLDYIINAEELSTYISAIADAAINRLINEGVKGIQSLTLSETTTGQPTRATINLSTSTREAINRNADQINQINQRAVNNLLEQLDAASSSVETARIDLTDALQTNGILVITLNDLIACQNQKGIVIDPNASTTLAIASSTTPMVLNQKISDSNTLLINVASTKAQVSASTASDPNFINHVDDLTEQAEDLENEALLLKSSIETALTQAQSDLTQCQNHP